MIELLGVAATAAVTILGFVQARRFVSDRLRFVDAVQSPLAPFIAGAAAALLVAPVAWLLPLVGTGTALLFGAAVALGVRAGVRRIRLQLPAG